MRTSFVIELLVSGTSLRPQVLFDTATLRAASAMPWATLGGA
jgi:hypothetical protein